MAALGLETGVEMEGTVVTMEAVATAVALRLLPMEMLSFQVPLPRRAELQEL
jgi:hypothetical protein